MLLPFNFQSSVAGGNTSRVQTFPKFQTLEKLTYLKTFGRLFPLQILSGVVFRVSAQTLVSVCLLSRLFSNFFSKKIFHQKKIVILKIIELFFLKKNLDNLKSSNFRAFFDVFFTLMDISFLSLVIKPELFFIH